jgi:hypothetical protein
MVKFHSWLIDRKIRAVNVSLDIPLGEYSDLASDILSRNELQRRKVSSAGKVYELLRRDLLEGCVMPPIILAVSERRSDEIRNDIANCCKAQTELSTVDRNKIEDFVQRAMAERGLIILDGLQRTYTVLECLNSVDDGTKREELKNRPIRLEIYVGLSKMGILYRMLTLNTGQTPMTFRHQIETLYHDYIDSMSLPDGITVIREVDERRSRGLGKYKYSDVVDMFYAYATGLPQSIDREALVTKLRELDFIEHYQPDSDDMLQLLRTYNQLVAKVHDSSNNWQAPEHQKDEFEVEGPFGKSIPSIFAKVQPMTGFGAECQRLVRSGQINGINDLTPLIEQCEFNGPPEDSLRQLLIILDQIAKTAKKIGDAQRTYFQFAFRQLFNKDSDSYLDLSGCWLAGQAAYKSMF